MMTLPDRIREMPPHWANETIRPFDENLYRESLPFARQRSWCDCVSVNVFKIVGTDHDSYKNKTWDWMIKNAKKISSNLKEYEWNPDYYLQTVKKKDMVFQTLDGSDYFIRQGNHRSTIARFDFHYRGATTLHGVTVDDVRIDQEMFRLFRELVKRKGEHCLPWEISCESELLSRGDTAGWMLETYRIGIRVKTPEKEWRFETPEAGEDFLASVVGTGGRRGGKKKWFSFFG